MTLIFVRFYLLDCDIQRGEIASSVIDNMISHLVSLHEKSIKEYWKIPEYLEVSMKFNFIEESNLELKFQEIITLLGSGWTLSNDSDDKFAIWNLEFDNIFCIPKTQWAIVEI